VSVAVGFRLFYERGSSVFYKRKMILNGSVIGN